MEGTVVTEDGLWKRHFHWKVILGWEVLGWIIAFTLTIAGLFLVFDQFGRANICFVITALLIFAKIVHAAITSGDSTFQRILFSFVLCGLLGVVTVEAVRGVNSWASKKEAAKTSPPATHDVQLMPELHQDSVVATANRAPKKIQWC